jgi:hypothetical protein
MKRPVSFLGLPLVALMFLSAVFAGASELKPGKNNRGGNGYSVPEPAAIALLGAGLVSLGLFARRKNKSK